MAAKKKNSKKNPLVFHEPTPQQELDYAMDRLVEKATLTHPQTQKLRKSIEKDIRRAAKAAPTATRKRQQKR